MTKLEGPRTAEAKSGCGNFGWSISSGIESSGTWGCTRNPAAYHRNPAAKSPAGIANLTSTFSHAEAFYSGSGSSFG